MKAKEIAEQLLNTTGSLDPKQLYPVETKAVIVAQAHIDLITAINDVKIAYKLKDKVPILLESSLKELFRMVDD